MKDRGGAYLFGYDDAVSVRPSCSAHDVGPFGCLHMLDGKFCVRFMQNINHSVNECRRK
jgi:hypothetical protein